MEAQTGETGKACRLVEEVEVVKGELLVHRLRHLNNSLIFLRVSCVALKLDETRAGLALDGEGNAVVLGRNSERLAERLELFADALELGGVDGDERAILGLRDA